MKYFEDWLKIDYCGYFSYVVGVFIVFYVKFGIQKSCPWHGPCKRNDQYEVCLWRSNDVQFEWKVELAGSSCTLSCLTSSDADTALSNPQPSFTLVKQRNSHFLRGESSQKTSGHVSADLILWLILSKLEPTIHCIGQWAAKDEERLILPGLSGRREEEERGEWKSLQLEAPLSHRPPMAPS